MVNETNESEVPVHHSRLLDILETLEKQIERQNSLRHALLRGMVYGLGTVIGATALVTLIAGLLKVITDVTVTF